MIRVSNRSDISFNNSRHRTSTSRTPLCQAPGEHPTLTPLWGQAQRQMEDYCVLTAGAMKAAVINDLGQFVRSKLLLASSSEPRSYYACGHVRCGT